MVFVGGADITYGIAGGLAPEQGQNVDHDAGVAAAVAGVDVVAIAGDIDGLPFLGLKGEELQNVGVALPDQLTLCTEKMDAPPSGRTNCPSKDRHLSKLLQLAIANRPN